MPTDAKKPLRSRLWFDNPDNPGMTALYLERYLNAGLTKDELTSGKPIIGIARLGLKPETSACSYFSRPRRLARAPAWIS